MWIMSLVNQQRSSRTSNRWCTVHLSSLKICEMHSSPTWRIYNYKHILYVQSQNPHFVSGWPRWMLLWNNVTVCHLNSTHSVAFSERATRMPAPGEKLYLRSFPPGSVPSLYLCYCSLQQQLLFLTIEQGACLCLQTRRSERKFPLEN